MMSKRNAGTTLLELTLATGLLTIVVGGGYTLLGTGVDTYDLGSTLAEVEGNAARALEAIATELSMAGRSVLHPQPSPPNSTSSLSFQRCIGFIDGAVAWGPPTIIEFRPEPDDPDDGVDNNGNGLIDEGMIVRVENAGTADERVVVIARNVRRYLEGEIPNNLDDNGNGLIDEAGLCFDIIGEVLTIRVTLERLDGKKRSVMHTAQTSIKMRNR